MIKRLVDSQLSSALKLGNYSPEFTKYISTPNKILRVFFPIKLQNKEYSFEGYRVQHNNLLGPYKGGLRYSPHISLDESTTLATWMTLKNSLVRLPLGGGKGGLSIDVSKYSDDELKEITKRYIQELNPVIGPYVDIPAPDLGTNSKIIDWMSKEYIDLQYEKNKINISAFTGKSILNEGSEGRLEATGQGVVNSILKYYELTNESINDKNVIVQGFGNVGYHSSKILSSLGAKIIAVGDIDGYIYNPDGLNLIKLEKIKANNNSILQYKDCQKINKEEFFSIKNDITIPAALQLQIDKNIAKKMQTSLIVEAANGPIDFEADKILYDNNVMVIPDILANSGGVITSYYEWQQNIKSEKWSKSKVNNKLKNRIDNTFERVYKKYLQNDISFRNICYIDSLDNIYSKYQKKY